MPAPKKAPKTVWYCSEYDSIKKSRKDCFYITDNNHCFSLQGKCIAKEYALTELGIDKKLVKEIEVELEHYDNVQPQMDRSKFAVEIVKLCRGVK